MQRPLCIPKFGRHELLPPASPCYQHQLRIHGRQNIRHTRSVLKRPYKVLSVTSGRWYFTASYNQGTVRTDEESVLSRARSYGIETIERLERESLAVSSTRRDRVLVDKADHGSDLRLWSILLEWQVLKHGIDGARSIWKHLTHRKRVARIDSGTAEADAIWKTLLNCAAQHKDMIFFQKLYDEAVRQKRPRLFVEIVGTLLKNSLFSDATHMSASLSDVCFRGEKDLREIYDRFISKSHEGLLQFCDLYRPLPVSRMYGHVMNKLWEDQRESDALMMHDFFLRKGDLPQIFEHVEPLMTYLAVSRKSPEPFIRALSDAGAYFAGQCRRAYSRAKARTVGISGDSLNIVSSRTMGMKPHKLSDTFVARAFATQAFSFGFSIHALRMLGLIEVGPFSVRQMGLSAPDVETLLKRFATLDEMEVDLGSSIYVRVVKRLAETQQHQLLHEVLATDMHHDIFEDRLLLENLLWEYYSNRKWQKVNVILTILNHGENSESAKQDARQILLRKAMKTENRRQVLKIMTQILTTTQNEPKVDRKNSAAQSAALRMIHDLMPSHIPYKPTAGHHTQQAHFFIAVLQSLMATGVQIPLQYWSAPLKQLAQAGDSCQVLDTILWLGQWSNSNGSSEHGQQLSSTRNSRPDRQVLQMFLHGELMSGMVYWSLRATIKGELLKEELSSWMRLSRDLKRIRKICDTKLPFKDIERGLVRGLNHAMFSARAPHGQTMRISADSSLLKLIDQFFSRLHWIWDRDIAAEQQKTSREEVLTGPAPLSISIEKIRPVPRHRKKPFRGVETSSDVSDVDVKETKGPRKDPDPNVVVYSDLFRPLYDEYNKR